MLVRLDPKSDIPIYTQIAEGIRSQIVSGALTDGERLPSARQLGESLDVNVHTVLKAYSELEVAGLVEMRRGRGGVTVRRAPGIGGPVSELVRRARDAGMRREDLIVMIEEAWT